MMQLNAWTWGNGNKLTTGNSVPGPASLALALLAMGAVGAATRRKA